MFCCCWSRGGTGSLSCPARSSTLRRHAHLQAPAARPSTRGCAHPARCIPAPHSPPPAGEAAKKAKAEGGEAAPAGGAKEGGSKDREGGREASRDPSRSPAPSKGATQRVLANEQLCLAFRYLDKTGAGYIRWGWARLCIFLLPSRFARVHCALGCPPACLRAAWGAHALGPLFSRLPLLLGPRQPPSPAPPAACLPAAGPMTCANCWMRWGWACTTQWSRSCASTCRCVRWQAPCKHRLAGLAHVIYPPPTACCTVPPASCHPRRAALAAPPAPPSAPPSARPSVAAGRVWAVPLRAGALHGAV